MIHIQSWAFGVKAKAVILTINLLPSHPVLWSKVTQSRGYSSSICFGLGKEICQTKLFQLFSSEAGNPRQIWRMLKGRKSLSLSGRDCNKKDGWQRPQLITKLMWLESCWRWTLFRKSLTIYKQFKEAELKIFTLLVHLQRNNLQRNCFEPLRDNQSCEENPSLFFKGSKNHFFESTRSCWIVGLGQKPGWYPSQKCVSRGVPNDLLDA